MAAEIKLSAATGQTLYTQQRSLVGQVWNTSANAVESETDANWTTYAVSLAEPVPGSGLYIGSVSLLPAGTWLLPIYVQQTTSPSTTDPILNAWPIPTALGASSPPQRGGFIFVLDWSGSVVNSIAPFENRGGNGQLAVPLPQDSAAYAQQMLATYMTAELALASTGIATVSIDGQMVTYRDLRQITDRIAYWKSQVAFLTGRRRRVSSIRMDRW